MEAVERRKKNREKHGNIVKSPSYSSNYSLYKSQLNEIEKQDAILARKLQEELNGSNNITANNNDADCINLISDAESDAESDADAEAEEEEEATYEVSSSSGDDDDDDDDLLLITNQPNAVDIGGSRMVKRSVSDSTVSFDFDDDDDDELFRYKAPSDFRLK